METHVLTLLDEVLASKAATHDPLMPPATEAELAALQAAASAQLAYVLPAAYRELLAKTNGLDCNGMQVYGTSDLVRTDEAGRVTYERMGLVEANLLWRDFEPNRDFVFLAETGDLLYCHNLVSGKFEVVDRITNEMDNAETDAYDTLDPLLERLFHKMLNHHSFFDPDYVPE